MKRLPKNIHSWIKTYNKMLLSHQLAVKFLSNILATKRFINFFVSTNHDMLWLPRNMINFIINNNDHEILLYFETKFTNNQPNFYIQLIVTLNGEDDDLKNLEIQCSKQEFINYLTLLIYYEDENTVFIEDIEYEEDDDVVTPNEFLSIRALKNETLALKEFFPYW